MQELKDGFLRELDKEDSGLQGKCKAIEEIVCVCDPSVFCRLKEENVVTQFYALRWIMLLMCQDFEMPNCVRLWDTLFSDEKRFDFLNYVSAAVIISVRDTILEGDFAAIMETLQGETKKIEDVPAML